MDPNDTPNISGNLRYWCDMCHHWCELWNAASLCWKYCPKHKPPAASGATA